MEYENIGANNRNDAFYRYKMPKMVTKTEGRGNGVKTNIVNNVEIAKALARPPSYTTKYFGCELGAQSKFDEKTGTSLVNGSHEDTKLSGLLENFIKKYVQCYGCGNPETEIIITKSQLIQLKCAACGFVSDVDMRDKLTGFILKNPPEVKKGKDKKSMRRAEVQRGEEGAVADEEQKKLKKGVKKKASSKDGVAKTSSSKKKSNGSDEDHASKDGVVKRTSKKKANGSSEDHASPPRASSQEKEEVEEEDDDDDDDDDNVQWQTDTSLEAAQQQIQEQLNSVTANMVMLSTNEKEKKAKIIDKAVEIPKGPNGHVSAENGNTVYEKLVQEIAEKIEKGIRGEQFQSFITSLPGSALEVMTALYEALFGDVEKGFAKEIEKKVEYLDAAVAHDSASQLLLLQAVEAFSRKTKSVAMKELGLVLKALYDADILEEEYIMKWYQEGLSKKKNGGDSAAVLKNAAPFINWLKNAESESDEE